MDGEEKDDDDEPPAENHGRTSQSGRRIAVAANKQFAAGIAGIPALNARIDGSPKSVGPQSYTNGMKTAVSIPDDVFEKAERLARRGRRSRSEVYSAALREYVARHSPDEVTEAMNKVCDEVEQGDDFVRAAAHRRLEEVEW